MDKYKFMEMLDIFVCRIVMVSQNDWVCDDGNFNTISLVSDHIKNKYSSYFCHAAFMIPFMFSDKASTISSLELEVFCVQEESVKNYTVVISLENDNVVQSLVTKFVLPAASEILKSTSEYQISLDKILSDAFEESWGSFTKAVLSIFSEDTKFLADDFLNDFEKMQISFFGGDYGDENVTP